jgi:hypothetical protein
MVIDRKQETFVALLEQTRSELPAHPAYLQDVRP